MGVLSFDGVDDKLKWATLASGLANVADGAWTVAVLLRRASGSSPYPGVAYLLSGSGAGVTRAGVSMDFSWVTIVDVDPYTVGAGSALTSTTDSYMVVAAKAAGAGSVRYSVYPKAAATWTHTTSSGTLADQIAATMLEIGAWQGGDTFPGWMGLVTFWEGQLSQANVEALVTNWRTSDLWGSAHGQPKFLAELNVAAGSVVDLAGNASSLTATGTTLDAGETLTSWNFNGTGGASPKALVVPRRPMRGLIPHGFRRV